MLTLVAFFAFALQDRPPRVEPPTPPPPPVERRRERDPKDNPEARERQLKELEKRAEEIQEQIDSLPAESPLRAEKAEQAKRLQAQIRQLRDGTGRGDEGSREGRPGQPPQPPRGLEPPQRFRPVENPDAVRAWLEKNEPETFQRLTRAQDEGRRPEVMQILSEAEPRMRQLTEMKERDPKGYERLLEVRRLERESVGLAEKARSASPDERERVSKQIAEVLGKLFDLREENRTVEVAELKKRVDALEKELANRKANKARIVEQRRRELLGEKGELDW